MKLKTRRSFFAIAALAVALVLGLILPPKSDEGAGGWLVVLGVLAIAFFVDFYLFSRRGGEKARGFGVQAARDEDRKEDI